MTARTQADTGDTAAPVCPGALSKPAILVVENDRGTFEELARPLNHLGFEAIHAAGPTEAFHLLRKREAALMIVNVSVPDVEGLETFCLMASVLPRLVLHTPSNRWPYHLHVPSAGGRLLNTAALLTALQEAAARVVGPRTDPILPDVLLGPGGVPLRARSTHSASRELAAVTAR